MKKAIVIAVLALVLLSGLAVTYLVITDKILLQSPVLIQKNPKITFILGNASYREGPADAWSIAIVGQVLKPGYEVKTEKNSQMDIWFHGNMAIRVSQDTTMKIEDMTVRKMLVSLIRGSIYGRFEKFFKDYSIQINTPTTIAAVRGTELGFEVAKKEAEDPGDARKGKKGKAGREAAKEGEDEKDAPEPSYVTTVYSLSGIAELHNPKHANEKILLSYQNKIVMNQDDPPESPEKMTAEEVSTIRAKLNSIHTEEVLIISDKINFETGSAKILPSSYEELNKILAIMQKKKVKIRIEGHTDIQGTEAFNQTLSVQRASSIRDYFTGKGIDPELLVIRGYGASKPVADNKTKEGRAINRRVEFIVVD